MGAVALVEDVSELRRLEAVRRDFVANLSHELKTPLGALSLLAETLDGEEDPDVVAGSPLGSGPKPRASHGSSTTCSTCRASKPGDGTLAPVALSAVLDEAVDGFYDQATSRGITLQVSPLSRGCG